MSTEFQRRINLRGRPMAIACVAAITTTLGAMYLMGRDTKKIEGNDSPYRVHAGSGISDASMTSSDVSAVVSVPKPGKERLHHQPDTNSR